METCTRGSRERITDTLIDCGVMEKYLLVGWPEIQMFMDHPRWSECIFCTEIPGHPYKNSTYTIPESIYNEVFSL